VEVVAEVGCAKRSKCNSLFPHPLSTLSEEPSAGHEAAPHKKMRRKKEVTEASGSPLFFLHLFPNLLRYEEVQNVVDM
jgi:hypothetical protein